MAIINKQTNKQTKLVTSEQIFKKQSNSIIISKGTTWERWLERDAERNGFYNESVKRKKASHL